MSSVTPEWAELVTAHLESLQQQLDALAAAPATSSLWPAPAPDLEEWVEGWLIPPFGMGVDVTGWQHIPALASELSALWIEYKAMTGPKAGGFDPLVWHSHLASARTRMSEYTRRARHRQAQGTMP